MKIAVVNQSRHEQRLFIDDSFTTLARKCEERGHVFSFHLLSEHEPVELARKLDDYDWVMVSLHRNKRAKDFFGSLKPKTAFYEHDQFYMVDDITWEGDRVPDVVFYANKQHRINRLPRTEKCKWVPVRWYKEEIQVDAEREENSVLIIDDCGVDENVLKMPQGWHQLPLSSIGEDLEAAGYSVTIKTSGKDRYYGKYRAVYPFALGAVEALKKHEFVIGYSSGILNEAFLFGSIPIIVEHKDDSLVSLDENLENHMNRFSLEIKVASASPVHSGMLGVVSHLPSTRKFPTGDAITKMKEIDRERCINDLVDFWGPETDRPFSDVVIETFEEW